MIDWEKVAELQDHMGPADMVEIITLFEQEVENITSHLGAGPEGRNLEEDFHYLKGAALTMGFAQFADTCAAAEALAQCGSVEPASIDAVLISYHQSITEFKAKKADILRG